MTRGSSTGSLLLIGLAHSAAPLDIRERVVRETARLERLGQLNPGSVVLSTCNRFELYTWVTTGRARTVQRLSAQLALAADLPLDVLQPYLTIEHGSAAILHLLRVALGLDSLVVGEEQIRGQVRAAYRESVARGPLLGQLSGIFDRVLEASRRLAAETPYVNRPSIASAAISVAAHEECLGVAGLSGRHAVILGAGAMAKAAAAALIARGARVTFLNRTPAHAASVAAHFGPGVEAGSLDRLPELLRTADLVIGATASRQPVIGAVQVAEAMPDRLNPRLLMLDIAVPRDFEAAARDIPGVTLIDLDDLERLCPVDITDRRAETDRLESGAAAEVGRIEEWLRIRALAPEIARLRTFGEQVRQGEIRRSQRQLAGLTLEQRAAVDALTSGIVNKLLHGPTLTLRQVARSDRRRPRQEARRLAGAVLVPRRRQSAEEVSSAPRTSEP